MTTAAAFVKLEEQAHSEVLSAEKSNNTVSAEITISEMAGQFDVSLRTLRFYEDRKLLRPRREGHARLYGGADRVRMQMIVKGKQLGFTLTEIASLIGTQESTDDFEGKLQPAQIVTQIDHLERQRGEIEQAIVRLRATQERLIGPVRPVQLRSAS